MDIGIVGLGLIGGSLARAVKRYTSHIVFAAELDRAVLDLAILEGTADGALISPEGFELIILALCPGAAVKYLEENADRFQKGAIVLDCCGTKRQICKTGFPLARTHGFYFIGGHPMAGRELSGYGASDPDLFKNASFILTPPPNFPEWAMEILSGLFSAIGFSGIKFSTPEEHDKVIAFTSQLPHIVSSAYVKSPAAPAHSGFSAGSFRDLSRVAYLNEEMWTELFLENRNNLLFETQGIIERLCEYRDALAADDPGRLKELLRDGRERREKISPAGKGSF